MQKLSIELFSSYINHIYEQERNYLIDSTEVIRDKALYKPEVRDLYRLYNFVIDNCVISILEFGSGWSTLALSMGLEFNEYKLKTLYTGYKRNCNSFRLCSVDSSKFFSDKAVNRLSENQRKLVDVFISKPYLNKFQGYPVSTWKPVPRFDFDLIYLDAPEPEQIVVEETALPMSTLYDLPIAGDICINEPYILPSTSIIVDGRTANVRFLESKLYRNWSVKTYTAQDISILYLDEEPLGSINDAHISFRKKFAKKSTLTHIFL